MEKIIVLGTGAGTVYESYNTCFVMESNDENYFLVDTGGGGEILKQLRRANIDPNRVRDVFISHKHIDHSHGAIWIFRNADLAMKRGVYEGILNFYCNDEVAEILKHQVYTLLREGQRQFLGKRIFINTVNDRSHFYVGNYEIEAIDLKSQIAKQFGFKMTLNNGKKLVFTGDESPTDELQSELVGYDWLLREAYCLESESAQYNPQRLGHSTVAAVSQKAEELGIKNLVLWHSREYPDGNRKELFEAEAKQFYSGNIYAPNDLDIIEL